jgi:hypothetical protein
MGTRIITMITLTLDKVTPVKAGFSVKDPVHQGPEWSTPNQITHPEGLTPRPLRKAVQGHEGLYSVTGWGSACQEALYPHLSITVHSTVQVIA